MSVHRTIIPIDEKQARIVMDWIKDNLKPRRTINYNIPTTQLRKYFEREEYGFSISEITFNTALEIIGFEIINNKDNVFANVSTTSKGIMKNNFSKFSDGYFNKYNEKCRLNVTREVKEELLEEEHLFKRIVSILCTLDDRALRNDPQRYYCGIVRQEGGIAFKDCATVFRTGQIEIKTSIMPEEQCNPIYPLIVASTINNLCYEFTQTIGDTVKDRLMEAAKKFLNNEDKYKILLEDLEKLGLVDSWNNFFGNIRYKSRTYI